MVTKLGDPPRDSQSLEPSTRYLSASLLICPNLSYYLSVFPLISVRVFRELVAIKVVLIDPGWILVNFEDFILLNSIMSGTERT
jgi:hypothetical protein